MVQSHYLYFLKHNIESRLFRIRQPLLASFKITYRCFLKCRSCPFWKMEPLRISNHQAKEIMDEFHRSGVRLVIFEGGEPFLWRDDDYRLEDLVRCAKQKFFRVGITTNGTLPIATEADVVWVSIDGLLQTHEKNRGKCFEKIMANIEASSHPNILAHITINRLNHQEIATLIKFLAEKVRGITIQFYYPFPNSDDLWLPEPDRIAVLNQLIELKRNGYPIFNSIATLEGLKKNTWKCHDWLIANAEPDGRMNIGCYLKDRAKISCEKCGFAAHTEIARAYDWNFGAIWAGQKTFKFRII
ncbi:MAG: radical SAM protein [bacterium]|nr:radical SAM protein [bacterium]